MLPGELSHLWFWRELFRNWGLSIIIISPHRQSTNLAWFLEICWQWQLEGCSRIRKAETGKSLKCTIFIFFFSQETEISILSNEVGYIILVTNLLKKSNEMELCYSKDAVIMVPAWSYCLWTSFCSTSRGSDKESHTQNSLYHGIWFDFMNYLPTNHLINNFLALYIIQGGYKPNGKRGAFPATLKFSGEESEYLSPVTAIWVHPLIPTKPDSSCCFIKGHSAVTQRPEMIKSLSGICVKALIFVMPFTSRLKSSFVLTPCFPSWMTHCNQVTSKPSFSLVMISFLQLFPEPSLIPTFFSKCVLWYCT